MATVPAALANDLTKLYEQATDKLRGEFVLVVGGAEQ
jgi:hypothetical protein